MSEDDSDEDYQKIIIVEDSSLNQPSPNKLKFTDNSGSKGTPITPHETYDSNFSLNITDTLEEENGMRELKIMKSSPAGPSGTAQTMSHAMQKDFSEDVSHCFEPLVP